MYSDKYRTNVILNFYKPFIVFNVYVCNNCAPPTSHHCKGLRTYVFHSMCKINWICMKKDLKTIPKAVINYKRTICFCGINVICINPTVNRIIN